MCTSGRGQVLIPWPNRLEDGSYEFDGRAASASNDEPEQRTAIHGLVRWASWNVAEREPNRVVMEHISIRSRATRSRSRSASSTRSPTDGLRVTTTATNVGPRSVSVRGRRASVPDLGTETVDPVVLRAPGRTVLTSDERGLPVGTGVGRGHGVRLPATEAHRQDTARQLLHRPRAGRGRSRPRRARRSGARAQRSRSGPTDATAT